MSSFRKVIPGLFLVLLLSAVILVPSANAADFRGGERIVIGADEVINDDLFVTANEIIIDGTVKGDVYALAQTITINGTVDYDVIAAAQVLTINGKVGSDARVAGQVIILGENAEITRGLLAAAQSLETRAGSSIGNDLLFVALQGLLAGAVGQDVTAGANGIELRGTVGGNVRVSVGSADTGDSSTRMSTPDVPVTIPAVPAGLTVAPSAVIAGDLIYESQQSARIESGSQVTGPVVQQTPVPNSIADDKPATAEELQAQQSQALVNTLLDHMRRFVILLLLGLLAVWLLPKFISTLAEVIRTKPLGSLGRGFLMVIGFFIALVAIVLVTLVLAILFGILTLGELAGMTVWTGISAFAALTFLYSIFTSYIAPIVVSYLIGRAILDRVQASWRQNRFAAFLIGLVLLSLASLVPILNVLIGLAVALIALGALALWINARRRGAVAAVMQPV